MPITATELRGHLYQYLDEILETGKPLEIKRHGRLLQVVPKRVPLEKKQSRSLEKHMAAVNGDPEDLVHMDWLSYWSEESNCCQCNLPKCTTSHQGPSYLRTLPSSDVVALSPRMVLSI